MSKEPLFDLWQWYGQSAALLFWMAGRYGARFAGRKFPENQLADCSARSIQYVILRVSSGSKQIFTPERNDFRHFFR